jgi:metal-responsive CopG/Arc/MetJ family transcriptional regulator
MATYTSTLPDELLKELADASKNLKMPKNKIIERAVKVYLEELDKAAFRKSFQRASKDEEMLAMAEEGMADYFQMLLDYENED